MDPYGTPLLSQDSSGRNTSSYSKQNTTRNMTGNTFDTIEEQIDEENEESSILLDVRRSSDNSRNTMTFTPLKSLTDVDDSTTLRHNNHLSATHDMDLSAKKRSI